MPPGTCVERPHTRTYPAPHANSTGVGSPVVLVFPEVSFCLTLKNYVLGHLLSKIKAVLPRVENTFGRAGCEPPLRVRYGLMPRRLCRVPELSFPDRQVAFLLIAQLSR